MKKIRKIEVSEEDITKKLRVATYCRVSTKYESQKSSIDLQRTHYEKYIQEQEIHQNSEKKSRLSLVLVIVVIILLLLAIFPFIMLLNKSS